jgi:RND family efflux transporter MFP subunit
MKTKVIIFSIIAVLVFSVAFTLKSNKHTVENSVYRPDPEKKILVQAATATRVQFDRNFTYTGTFAPFREVMLQAQVYGEVKAVYFDEGDKVGAGKTLIQIDDAILRAQYAAADANYRTAKRNLERYESAAASGGVSNLQLDNLKLNLATTESQLKQLARQIELSRISAPFSGTMTLRSVEPGSLAGANALARISDIAQLKLEISVPEKEIGMFRTGETVQISTDIYPDKAFKGTVDYVSDRADNAHNYDVKIVLKNNSASPLKAGMYGTAMMKKGLGKETLIIPRSALLGSAKNPQVFVVRNDKAVLTRIQTGSTGDDAVEVLEGLEEGDQVVTTGHINLADGSNVTIANKN